MKLIQLNIWGGKLINEIAEFIAAEKPALVCMQEVHDIAGETNYLFGPLWEIKKLSGMADSHMSPSFAFNYMERTASYGNALLSNIKSRQTSTTFTHGKFIKSYDCESVSPGQDPRNFLHVELENGLHIITYHGMYVPGSKAGNDITLAHSALLANYIANLSGAVVLTGDFNLEPGSTSIRLLGQNLRNLSLEYNLDTSYSQFGRHNVVCDYIFVNDQVKVKSFGASEAVVSDHKPLILEFDL